MFNWIRERVKQAVFAGVSDALQELNAGTVDTGEAVEYLEQTIELKRLPAPTVARSSGKRGEK